LTKESVKNTTTEIIFLVEDDPEGGYTARALGESIFTQADDLSTLKEMVRDAVRCHFVDGDKLPEIIRLHIVRDEVIAS
jgi:dephospho-CoA kinase